MDLLVYLKISIVTALAALVISTAGDSTFKSPSKNIPPSCKNPRKTNITREITINGKPRQLEVQWGSGDTNHANAALLFVILKYAQGYKDIVLVKGKETLCELTSELLKYKEDAAFDKVVIHVAVKPPDCPDLYSCDDPQNKCTMAGPKLDIMGLAMAPIEPQLHEDTSTRKIITSTYNSSLTNIQKFNRLSKLHEYDEENISIFSLCRNSKNVNKSNEVISECTPVQLDLDSNGTYYKEYLKQKEISNFTFQLMPFVDKPTCPNSNYSLAYRVAPANLLQQFAPRILKIVRYFAPTSEDIKEILNISGNSAQDMEDAACQYYFQQRKKLQTWASAYDPVLSVHVLLCEGDLDNLWYKHISTKFINKNHFNPKYTEINCSDENDFNLKMFQTSLDMRWTRMIGAVGRGAGAALAAKAANTMETQVVLYDAPPDKAVLGSYMRTATGKVKPLAVALKHFLIQNKWRRIAIISDRTQLAEDFNKTLCANLTISHREYFIDGEDTSADEILQQIKKESVPGRIFFVNTDTKAAGKVLCAARNLNMTDRNGYAWIVREWGSPPPPCNITDIRHFTVTYWWRGGNESYVTVRDKERLAENSIISDMRKIINEECKKYRDNVWPPFTAPLVDAIQLLIYEYKTTLKSYPGLQYNLHGAGNAKLYSKSFTNETMVPGLVQTLKQKDYSQEHPLVFIYAWRGNSICDLLAVWQVENDTVKIISTVNETYPEGSAPTDGSSHCLTIPTGDPYDPTCQDASIFSAVALFIVMMCLVYFGYRYWMRTQKQREDIIRMRILTQNEQIVKILDPYRMSRSSVEFIRELGKGNFGRVTSGLLTLQKRTTPVAVKSLLEEKSLDEQSKLLYEAYILSHLSHVNIVRLVGVCAVDGPPLVIMERASCDLCTYLRERRHYVETEDIEMDEASPISPRKLTRLTREAATALDYLCVKKVVHRDVRAANCLIDDSDTLKLADFGMAREMTSSEKLEKVNSSVQSEVISSIQSNCIELRTITIPEPMNYNYFCKRNDKFPLSWMAPESISGGVFSSASDVWSLGVMILEIVTLGQLPFPSWSPEEIYKHLIQGGLPKLPLDIYYSSREVMEMCWSVEPRSRPAAADICTHLADKPEVIRYAVGPREDMYSTISDRGYIEIARLNQVIRA